jgi:hypothetical protein
MITKGGLLEVIFEVRGNRAPSNVRRLASSSKCFSTIAENSKEDLWQQKSQ